MMNTAAKIMCIVTVATFCGVGVIASSDEISQKNNSVSGEGNDEIAYCLPEPTDVSSTFNLAHTDTNPTYTSR